jgi:hypothetical protein
LRHAQRVGVELVSILACLADRRRRVDWTVFAAEISVADVVVESGPAHAGPAVTTREVVPQAVKRNAVALRTVQDEARQA